MGASKLLLLEYNASLVPEGGAAVLCQLGAPIPSQGKDPAGHLFHDFALRQRGLLSERAHAALRACLMWGCRAPACAAVISPCILRAPSEILAPAAGPQIRCRIFRARPNPPRPLRRGPRA
jgi:hypothetical protein